MLFEDNRIVLDLRDDVEFTRESYAGLSYRGEFSYGDGLKNSNLGMYYSESTHQIMFNTSDQGVFPWYQKAYGYPASPKVLGKDVETSVYDHFQLGLIGDREIEALAQMCKPNQITVSNSENLVKVNDILFLKRNLTLFAKEFSSEQFFVGDKTKKHQFLPLAIYEGKKALPLSFTYNESTERFELCSSFNGINEIIKSSNVHSKQLTTIDRKGMPRAEAFSYMAIPFGWIVEDIKGSRYDRHSIGIPILMSYIDVNRYKPTEKDLTKEFRFVLTSMNNNDGMLSFSFL